MFTVIEFSQEYGGGLAVINSKWLTPFKKEVFWPPYKDTKIFNKAIQKGEEVHSEKWKLFSITKCYYTTDDFEKAQKKLKQAEETSDLQSDIEGDTSLTLRRKRKVNRPIRFDSDDDAEIDDIPRPPNLKNIKKNSEAPNDYQYETGSSSSIPSCSGSIKKDRQLTQDFTRPAKELVTSSEARSEIIPKSSAFEILLTNLLEVKQQNKKILSLLEQKESFANSVLPDDLPVTFPLNNSDDLDILENYLRSKTEDTNAIVKHWSAFGGKDVTSKTNRILKEVLGDSLAKDYNFYGRHTKKAFSELKLNSEILRAVKLTCNGCSTKEIEDVIKTWLKHAPERLKKRNQKNN